MRIPTRPELALRRSAARRCSARSPRRGRRRARASAPDGVAAGRAAAGLRIAPGPTGRRACLTHRPRLASLVHERCAVQLYRYSGRIIATGGKKEKKKLAANYHRWCADASHEDSRAGLGLPVSAVGAEGDFDSFPLLCLGGVPRPARAAVRERARAYAVRGQSCGTGQAPDAFPRGSARKGAKLQNASVLLGEAPKSVGFTGRSMAEHRKAICRINVGSRCGPGNLQKPSREVGYLCAGPPPAFRAPPR